MEYSLLQGINLTLKYLPYPFEPSPSPPKKTKNSKSARSPLYEQPPSKFCRNCLPP